MKFIPTVSISNNKEFGILCLKTALHEFKTLNLSRPCSLVLLSTAIFKDSQTSVTLESASVGGSYAFCGLRNLV